MLASFMVGCPKWAWGARVGLWVPEWAWGVQVGLWVPEWAFGCPSGPLGARVGFGCPSGPLGAKEGFWVPEWAFGSFEMFAHLFIYFSFNFQFCIDGGIWDILILKPGGWVPLFWVLRAMGPHWEFLGRPSFLDFLEHPKVR
jgi:hypothetical protein